MRIIQSIFNKQLLGKAKQVRLKMSAGKLFFMNTLLALLFTSCSVDNNVSDTLSGSAHFISKPAQPWAVNGIKDLKKGDIIVKPNINLLPGSAFVSGGFGYGHAAIVTKGAEHENPDSLLALSWIFESHSRPVHRTHQLREVPGFMLSDDPGLHNDSFRTRFTGNRYRLRLDMPESQIDSIIAFVRSQKGSYSSWNAMKRFPGIPHIEELVKEGKRENWADNSHWYCSLLIWQAVLYVTGIDLDPNAGYYVFPNDLIVSPYFDNIGDVVRRARF